MKSFTAHVSLCIVNTEGLMLFPVIKLSVCVPVSVCFFFWFVLGTLEEHDY
jgi:hypothetical protein